MAENNITLDPNINAGANEGFVNHPRIVLDSSTDRANAGIWARGMDMARPYITNVRTQVKANPWLGVGIAAGLFLTVGYFVGRRYFRTDVTGASDFYSPNYSPNFSSRNSADFYGSTEAGMSNTVGVRSDLNK